MKHRFRALSVPIVILASLGGGSTRGLAQTSPASCTAPIVGESFSVDGAGNVFVAGSNAVVRFAPDANGNVAAAATICGTNTGLVGVREVVVAGQRLYVATAREILVFPTTATGDVAPDQSYGIESFKTDPPWQLRDFAVDGHGNIVALIDDTLQLVTWSGNPDALHEMRDTLATPTHQLGHVIVDSRNDVYYSDAASNVMLSTASYSPFKSVLNTHGMGNTLALDGNGRLYVGVNGQAVLVITGATSGTQTVGKLTDGTQLEQLQGLATDVAGRLYVLNCAHDGTAAVLVFPPQVTGDVKPVAIIAGPATGLACGAPNP
jgi:hypothetical protein